MYYLGLPCPCLKLQNMHEYKPFAKHKCLDFHIIFCREVWWIYACSAQEPFLPLYSRTVQIVLGDSLWCQDSNMISYMQSKFLISYTISSSQIILGKGSPKEFQQSGRPLVICFMINEREGPMVSAILALLRASLRSSLGALKIILRLVAYNRCALTPLLSSVLVFLLFLLL